MTEGVKGALELVLQGARALQADPIFGLWFALVVLLCVLIAVIRALLNRNG